MNENIAVNVTLPKEVIKYLDIEARKTYLSRATVVRQLLLQKIDEIKIADARRRGFSIRKIAQIYNIEYTKVLQVLHITQVDAEDTQGDVSMELTLKELIKKKS